MKMFQFFLHDFTANKKGKAEQERLQKNCNFLLYMNWKKFLEAPEKIKKFEIENGSETHDSNYF